MAFDTYVYGKDCTKNWFFFVNTEMHKLTYGIGFESWYKSNGTRLVRIWTRNPLKILFIEINNTWKAENFVLFLQKRKKNSFQFLTFHLQIQSTHLMHTKTV